MADNCLTCKYGYCEYIWDDLKKDYKKKFWCTRFPQWMKIEYENEHFCGEWG